MSFGAGFLALALAASASAQERPMMTADPVPLPHGTVALELGVDALMDISIPLSGLEGDLLRVPAFGIRFGMGGIGEFQVSSGLNVLLIERRGPGPFADQIDVDGDVSHDIEDPVVATKIQFHQESRWVPATGLRVATRLPSAGQASGLGNDTMDFLLWVLAGKTVKGTRLLANVGLGILALPERGERQNDVLLYGLAASRAVDEHWTVVGELHGRNDIKEDTPFGTEDHAQVRLGTRWSRGSLTLDGAYFMGLHGDDPDSGATVGLTWVGQAIR